MIRNQDLCGLHSWVNGSYQIHSNRSLMFYLVVLEASRNDRIWIFYVFRTFDGDYASFIRN
jgi:hypothetical protein